MAHGYQGGAVRQFFSLPEHFFHMRHECSRRNPTVKLISGHSFFRAGFLWLSLPFLTVHYDLAALLQQEKSESQTFPVGHTECVPHSWAPSFLNNPSFSSHSPCWPCMMRDLRDSFYSSWRYLFCLLVPCWLLVFVIYALGTEMT